MKKNKIMMINYKIIIYHNSSNKNKKQILIKMIIINNNKHKDNLKCLHWYNLYYNIG